MAVVTHWGSKEGRRQLFLWEDLSASSFWAFSLDFFLSLRCVIFLHIQCLQVIFHFSKIFSSHYFPRLLSFILWPYIFPSNKPHLDIWNLPLHWGFPLPNSFPILTDYLSGILISAPKPNFSNLFQVFQLWGQHGLFLEILVWWDCLRSKRLAIFSAQLQAGN